MDVAWVVEDFRGGQNTGLLFFFFFFFFVQDLFCSAFCLITLGRIVRLTFGFRRLNLNCKAHALVAVKTIKTS